MLEIKTYALSEKGRRKNNQDKYLVFKPSDNATFIAVADGMGGTAGGRIASRIVLEKTIEILNEYFANQVEPSQLKEILIKIFFSAQKVINSKVQKRIDLKGMGTTLACVLILDDKFVWGNLGDSRVYYYNNEFLKLITVDHTHIQDYLQNNNTKIQKSILDKYSNVLTRTIDGGIHEPDIFPNVLPYETLKNGNAFLICSDGLIIDKAEDNSPFLEQYLVGSSNLETAAQNLISMAYAKGSDDNITVALCEIGTLIRKNYKLKNYNSSLSNFDKQKATNNKITHWLLGSILVVILLIAFLLIIKY